MNRCTVKQRDIEHHFDSLFNSILERKEVLLKSLETSFAFLSMSLSAPCLSYTETKMIEEQKLLKSKVENATKVLEAGLSLLTINQDAARSILKVNKFRKRKVMN